ncbi:MAG: hypothetical protein H6721_26120, partial [Sandaracinus sp.]|nr:hypothetical protein [Sandaracinus sp.]
GRFDADVARALTEGVPLALGLSDHERSRRLSEAQAFPEVEMPNGELADWALVALDAPKHMRVAVALAASRFALSESAPNPTELAFLSEVLEATQTFLDGDGSLPQLQTYAELWWTLVRNPPSAAGALAHLGMILHFVTGYDPEGWGAPPDDPAQLEAWLAEAADNRGAIVDVLGLAQHLVGAERGSMLVATVRDAVAAEGQRKG